MREQNPVWGQIWGQNNNLQNNYKKISMLLFIVAERGGFEPPIQFPIYTLSRRALSTTQAPLHCHALRLLDFSKYTDVLKPQKEMTL